jgi:broad specificity phosphatase PhoE
MPEDQAAQARIALVRHGQSAHVHAGWIDAAGFRAWRQAYEAAGIRPDERVPAALRGLVDGTAAVVCSDAARAMASARLLAPGHELVISPLLRELALEGPALGGLRLPLLAWALAVGGRNAVLRLRGRHPSAAEVARIDAAAVWLEVLTVERAPNVVAVTHASFRMSLFARLLQRGWKPEPGRRTLKPWSAWVLRRPR